MNTRVLLWVFLTLSLAVVATYSRGSSTGSQTQGSVVASEGFLPGGSFDADLGLLGDPPAPRGTPFPRPAYNSGWLRAQYGNMAIRHNLGGNPDDYVVSVDSKDSTGQIHDVDGVYMMGDNWVGMMWYGLSDTSITVSLAGASPATLYRYVRVRIWVVR